MTKIQKWADLFAFLLMILCNILANLLHFGGFTTAAISTLYPSLFSPAPYTFCIWFIIYLLLSVFVGLQLTESEASNTNNPFSTHLGPWFLISCILNTLWILSWHYQFLGLSVLLMLGLLISLLFLNQRAIINRDSPMLYKVSLCGFQIYLGWVCAATLANLSVYFSKSKYYPFAMSEKRWTILAIIIGALAGIAFIFWRYKIAATFAILWAYLGILVKHLGNPLFQKNSDSIILTLAVSIGIMILLLKIYILHNKA